MRWGSTTSRRSWTSSCATSAHVWHASASRSSSPRRQWACSPWTAWIPVYGARPLKRLIQRQVVDNIAGLIIDGRLHEGETVLVDVAPDGATLVAEPAITEVHVDPEDLPIEPDEME